MCAIFVDNQQNHNRAFSPPILYNNQDFSAMLVPHYKKDATESVPLIELPVRQLIATMVEENNLVHKSPETDIYVWMCSCFFVLCREHLNKYHKFKRSYNKLNFFRPMLIQ